MNAYVAACVLRIDRDLLSDDRVASLSDAAFRAWITSWVKKARRVPLAMDGLVADELRRAGLYDDGPISPPRFASASPLVSIAHREWSREAYDSVYARDDRRCRYCGGPGRTIDHVTPRCQGGTDDADNLVVACRSCNSRKGGRTPEQAGMVLR